MQHRAFAERATAALFVVAATLLPTIAHAGRALVEPKGWRQLAVQAPKPVVDEASAAAGLSGGCAAATIASGEVQGLGCRVAVAAQLMGKKPLAKAADVDALRAFAVNVDATARSVAEYQPLAATPGFARNRFETHRAACRALLDVYDRLAAIASASQGASLVDPKTQVRASAVLATFGPPKQPLKHAACGCVQQSLGLSRGADASLEETGALQSVLTSRGCFLDEAKLRTERTPGDGVPSDAAAVAAARSDEARIAEYARARDVGLERCREKTMAAGRVKDPAKLEKCVCGEISRWQFPARRGQPPLAVKLPIGLGGVEDRVVVDVLVDAAGAPAKCGPLAGPALPTTGS